MKVSVLVKQGYVNLAHSVGLSAQETVNVRDSVDLNPPVRAAESGESGVDAVGPSGGLVGTAIRCVGNGYRQVGMLIGVGVVAGCGDGDGVGRVCG